MLRRYGQGLIEKLDFKRHKWLPVAALVAVFAVVGVVLLASSHAATFNTAMEAEAGTLSGNAGAGNDNGASGGAAVLFGSSTNGGNTGGNTNGGGSTSGTGLNNPVKFEIANELVSSAENSSLQWYNQFGYIEWNVEGVASENRGYTAGIVGFCSGTGDMILVLKEYDKLAPGNALSKYEAAVQTQTDLGMGKVTQAGLGTAFMNDWKAAAKDTKFQQAQINIRDQLYKKPAVDAATADGVGTLGQFAYYDAAIVHGADGMETVRTNAKKKAKAPSQGGDEKTYLAAYMTARIAEMQTEQAHSDVTRITNAQQVFLNAGNLDLKTPLTWSVYGDPYSLASDPTPYTPK